MATCNKSASTPRTAMLDPHLVIQVHGVNESVAQLRGVQAVVTGEFVVSVEVSGFLSRFVYHIVVYVRIVR